MRHIDRRQLLAGLAALGLAPRSWAFGDDARFIPAMVQHGGRFDARASGLRRLAWELQRRTSVEVIPDARAVSLASAKIFEYPFLYFGADGPFPTLSAQEMDNLRRYLTFGGFVLADANDGSDGDGFDASFRETMQKVLPKAPLSPLPSSHVVFKSFFMLDSAPGRLLKKPHVEAAMVGKRAAVIYSQNDLLGALNRDDSGSFEFEATPGGDRQREMAIRLALNVCMYALCLDYKDDAVHLPLILNKRR